jgi:hypothetical protein
VIAPPTAVGVLALAGAADEHPRRARLARPAARLTPPPSCSRRAAASRTRARRFTTLSAVERRTDCEEDVMRIRLERRPWIGRAAVVSLLIAIASAGGARVDAQQPVPVADSGDVEALRAEIAALRSEYEQRIAALEERLAALQPPATTAAVVAEEPSAPEVAATTEAPPEPAPAPVPTTEAPVGEATAAVAPTSNYFNPAISLIGNFLGVAGRNPVEDLPSFDLRESELGLQAVVDPYMRADIFVAFGEEGGNVEEGFVTFTSLPAGLLAKVGRIRAQFGKTNPLHLHVLPWADEPLPIVNLLGGDEGWAGDGVSIARLVPLPGDTFSEATLQVFRGDREGLFEADERGDLAYALRYRVFRDFTEATNLDLGVSYGWGPNATEVASDDPDAEPLVFRGKTRLTGIDATLRWKPLSTARYRSFTGRAELIRSRREQPGDDPTALGWFVSGDYQLARRWFVGGRLDASEHADEDALRDRGAALTLTFWPSEFSQLRAEYRRRRYQAFDSDFARFDTTANELLLQLQFAMGAHGAHPF